MYLVSIFFPTQSLPLFPGQNVAICREKLHNKPKPQGIKKDTVLDRETEKNISGQLGISKQNEANLYFTSYIETN